MQRGACWQELKSWQGLSALSVCTSDSDCASSRYSLVQRPCRGVSAAAAPGTSLKSRMSTSGRLLPAACPQVATALLTGWFERYDSSAAAASANASSALPVLGSRSSHPLPVQTGGVSTQSVHGSAHGRNRHTQDMCAACRNDVRLPFPLPRVENVPSARTCQIFACAVAVSGAAAAAACAAIEARHACACERPCSECTCARCRMVTSGYSERVMTNILP